MFQFLPGQDPQWRKSEFSVGPDNWHKCCIVVLGIQNPFKIFFWFHDEKKLDMTNIKQLFS